MALNAFKFRIAVFAVALLGSGGCQSSSKLQPTVLPAPVGTNVAVVHHNDEGLLAYQQGQWESARQHSEAAITASPELAEAHYNVGMVLYRLGASSEGDAHFIKAANVAPGDKVIRDSPPLKSGNAPDKGSHDPW